MIAVGTRVALTTDHYGDSDHNPVWGGSQGKTMGTVRDSNPFDCLVEWDNGYQNHYTNDRLFQGSPDEATPKFKIGDIVKFEGRINDWGDDIRSLIRKMVKIPLIITSVNHRYGDPQIRIHLSHYEFPGRYFSVEEKVGV